jgi:hypothetical protein
MSWLATSTETGSLTFSSIGSLVGFRQVLPMMCGFRMAKALTLRPTGCPSSAPALGGWSEIITATVKDDLIVDRDSDTGVEHVFEFSSGVAFNGPKSGKRCLGNVGNVTEIQSGDFNGDGLADVLVYRSTKKSDHLRHLSLDCTDFGNPLSVFPQRGPTTRRVIGNFDGMPFYVSPSGKDSNDGSVAKPFATFERARKAVAKINSNMNAEH